MHDIPDLVFKSVYLFNMNPANVCLFKVSKLTIRICLKYVHS